MNQLSLDHPNLHQLNQVVRLMLGYCLMHLNLLVNVVAFEKVSDGEKEVAVHEDINDEDQTVTIKKSNPEIGSTLINKSN